jgi:hypothetical protein
MNCDRFCSRTPLNPRLRVLLMNSLVPELEITNNLPAIVN